MVEIITEDNEEEILSLDDTVNDVDNLDYLVEEDKLNELKDKIYSLYDNDNITTFSDEVNELDVVSIDNDINKVDVISKDFIDEEVKEIIEDLNEEIIEDVEEKISKTVDSVDNDLCLVDNILSEDTMRLIVFDEEKNENEEEHDTDYFNAILLDLIIGLLIFVFTILSIIFIWFMVFLITY